MGTALVLQGESVRIALFGIFGVGNFGNEASLAAILRDVRDSVSGGDLICICPRPLTVAKDHNVAAIGMDGVSPASQSGKRSALKTRLSRVIDRFSIGRELGKWWRALKVMAATDVLIVPGTGIMDDFGTTPFGMPYDLFRWCVSARVCGTKIAFVSVGAGPINDRRSALFMKAAARVATYRSFRDVISKAYMHSLGLDTSRDRVFPDIVFGLPTPVAMTPAQPSSNVSTVAVGVMAYYGWDNRADVGGEVYRQYIGRMMRFVGWLLDRGYHVRLVIGETVDRTAVRDLLDGLAGKGATRVDSVDAPTIDSLEDLMMQLASADIVVATRFHNVVASLMMGKPVISLGYADKNEALLREMGLGRFCQHVETFDVETLQAMFLEVMAKKEVLAEAVRSKVSTYRELLAQQSVAVAESCRLVGAPSEPQRTARSP